MGVGTRPCNVDRPKDRGVLGNVDCQNMSIQQLQRRVRELCESEQSRGKSRFFPTPLFLQIDPERDLWNGVVEGFKELTLTGTELQRLPGSESFILLVHEDASASGEERVRYLESIDSPTR